METLDGPPEGWGVLRRFAARLGLLYLPLTLLSGLGGAVTIVPLGPLAARLAGVRIPVPVPTGSGDRAADWWAALALAVLSVPGAAAWTVLARKGPPPHGAYEALRVLLRYLLATALLMYGFAKTDQFGGLSPMAYAEPLGTMLPMDLLWTFMGYSEPYALFSGAVEVAGASLLLFRRTATLGALACAGAMANVLALDLCYDVPVKLYSFHLLLAALVLALPDASRLWSVLVLNRPTVPRELGPIVRSRRLRTLALTAKGVFVVGAFAVFGLMALGGWRERHRAPSPLTGIWAAEAYRGAGPRWDWALVDLDGGSRVMVVHLAGGRRYGGSVEARGGTLSLSRRGQLQRWSCRLDGPDRLALSSLPGEPVERIELFRDRDRFPLMRRGFHWVQERPRTP